MENPLSDSPKSFIPPMSPMQAALIASLKARDNVKTKLIEWERIRRLNAPNGPAIATRGQANEIRFAAVELKLAANALINNVDDWITQQQPPLPK